MEHEWISAIRAHAHRNYNKDGWDYLVECWEDGDILEAVSGAETLEQAIKKIAKTLKRLDGLRREIESTAF